MLPFAGRGGKVAQKGSKSIMIVMVLREVHNIYAEMKKTNEILSKI